MQDKSRTTPCYSSTTSIVTYPFLKAKTKKADKMTAIAITNIEPRVSVKIALTMFVQILEFRFRVGKTVGCNEGDTLGDGDAQGVEPGIDSFLLKETVVLTV